MSYKYKFCASCFNYINSCDCLGNLEDHEHINDFERPGKDDDMEEDDNEDSDVWYFRVPVGPTLDEFGNIGLGGLLSSPLMWTKEEPADPSMYLSIPVNRLPFDKVNVGGKFPQPPQYIQPKNPWEIPFFKLRDVKIKEKTDEQLLKDLQECIKDCGKKKLGKRFCIAKCNVKYLYQKAQNELVVTMEDLFVAVQKVMPENPEGFYVFAPLAKRITPPRLWNFANQAIVPGCGFQWIEMHLIDGSDPAKDMDCNGKLSSNVDGVDDYWNDNSSGGGPSYIDYYGQAGDLTSDARMLMMPFVPPPVPPVGPTRCTPWAIANGFCDEEERPPEYKPPPWDKPPPTTDPPVVIFPPDPPIVDPPVDPPVIVPPSEPPIFPLDWEVKTNTYTPFGLFQVKSDGDVPFTTNQFKLRPHLQWGATGGTLWPPDEAAWSPELKWKVPAENLGTDTSGTAPGAFFNCMWLNPGEVGDPVTLTFKFTFVSGNVGDTFLWQFASPGTGGVNHTVALVAGLLPQQFTHTTTCQNRGPCAERIAVTRIAGAGGPSKLESRIQYFCPFDPKVRPVFRRYGTHGFRQQLPPLSGDTWPPVLDSLGILLWSSSTNRDVRSITDYTVTFGLPAYLLWNGEHSNEFSQFGGTSSATTGVITKSVNTGDGGVTPYWSHLMAFGTPNASGFCAHARYPGSNGSMTGIIYKWIRLP